MGQKPVHQLSRSSYPPLPTPATHPYPTRLPAAGPRVLPGHLPRVLGGEHPPRAGRRHPAPGPDRAAPVPSESVCPRRGGGGRRRQEHAFGAGLAIVQGGEDDESGDGVCGVRGAEGGDAQQGAGEDGVLHARCTRGCGCIGCGGGCGCCGWRGEEGAGACDFLASPSFPLSGSFILLCRPPLRLIACHL